MGKARITKKFFKPVDRWISSKHRDFDDCRVCYRPSSVGFLNATFQNGPLRDFETIRFPAKRPNGIRIPERTRPALLPATVVKWRKRAQIVFDRLFWGFLCFVRVSSPNVSDTIQSG